MLRATIRHRAFRRYDILSNSANVAAALLFSDFFGTRREINAHRPIWIELNTGCRFAASWRYAVCFPTLLGKAKRTEG